MSTLYEDVRDGAGSVRAIEMCSVRHGMCDMNVLTDVYVENSSLCLIDLLGVLRNNKKSSRILRE